MYYLVTLDTDAPRGLVLDDTLIANDRVAVLGVSELEAKLNRPVMDPREGTLI